MLEAIDIRCDACGVRCTRRSDWFAIHLGEATFLVEQLQNFRAEQYACSRVCGVRLLCDWLETLPAQPLEEH